MIEEAAFDNKPLVQEDRVVGLGHFPSWLHRKLPKGKNLWKTGSVVKGQRLHTVCEEAKCPNLMECWSANTATFLALGDVCTRNCGFCNIATSSTPPPPDENEPERIAESVRELGIKHVVITMVTRDDLPEGGAIHLARIITAIRERVVASTIEVLVSDFGGVQEAWDIILEGQPEIFNHNIETVRELTPRIRHRATYERSLSLLRYAKETGKQHLTKSGMMLGLGETHEQVKEAIDDLHSVGVDVVTLGQYLQPHHKKRVVKAFITPEQFQSYADYGHEIGILHMYCGPFVRSSYNAAEVMKTLSR